MLHVKKKRKQRLKIGTVTITIADVRGNEVAFEIENPQGVAIDYKEPRIEKLAKSDCVSGKTSAK